MATFIAWTGNPSALTAPLATVATSAVSGTPKTLLQLKANSTQKFWVKEWGYTFDAAPTANMRCELLTTGTVGATVTQHTNSTVLPFNDISDVSVLDYSSTTASGYNASAEGSIVASRLLDYQYENGLYYKRMWALGEEPRVAAGQVLRMRFTPTSAAAVNVVGYIIIEE